MLIKASEGIKYSKLSKELGISNIDCREIYPSVFEIKKNRKHDRITQKH